MSSFIDLAASREVGVNDTRTCTEEFESFISKFHKEYDTAEEKDVLNTPVLPDAATSKGLVLHPICSRVFCTDTAIQAFLQSFYIFFK